MAREGEIILFATTPQGQNENGFYLPQEEVSRSVFCFIQSIGTSEFYKAAQAAIKVEAKVRVHSRDYDWEKIVELEGKRYGVLRTYETKNGEFIELTLGNEKYLAEAENGNF